MTTLTPDEVEVGRRNLIAQLRYEYADGRIPEITLNAETVQSLIAVLEASKPTVVDREALTETLCDHDVVWRGEIGERTEQCACLPTQDEIAEAIHDQTANHQWRGERCDKRAQRTRLREAAAVHALLTGLHPKATEGKS